MAIQAGGVLTYSRTFTVEEVLQFGEITAIKERIMWRRMSRVG